MVQVVTHNSRKRRLFTTHSKPTIFIWRLSANCSSWPGDAEQQEPPSWVAPPPRYSVSLAYPASFHKPQRLLHKQHLTFSGPAANWHGQTIPQTPTIIPCPSVHLDLCLTSQFSRSYFRWGQDLYKWTFHSWDSRTFRLNDIPSPNQQDTKGYSWYNKKIADSRHL